MDSPPRGTCQTCRHANHDTMDAEDGFWACPWIGGVRPSDACRVQYTSTNSFAFEPYDGSNGTWNRDGTLRTLPKGYEGLDVRVIG
jgi:hypothetical protein